MASSHTSEVSICNQALGFVGGNLITSLGDLQTEATLCRDAYPALRDAVLEIGEWSFAIRRDKLAHLADSAVEPGFGNAHQVPDESIRLLTVHANQNFSQSDDLVWVVEGRKVLSNHGDLWARYIHRVINPVEFSPGFVMALAYRIASELAIPIARSKSLQDQMFGLYEKRVDEAMGLDGMQGSTRRFTASWSDKSRRRFHTVR